MKSFLKNLHTEWYVVVAWAALTGIDFGINSATQGSIDAGLGVASFFLVRWARRYGEAKRLKAQAVPVKDEGPPDPQWFAEHNAEAPGCELCKSLGWTE